MDIPVRVSINRKSLDGKNANGPYRDGKEFHRLVTCPPDRVYLPPRQGSTRVSSPHLLHPRPYASPSY